MGNSNKTNKIRILWITNIPSPYRVDFFKGFGKFCDLTVVFERAVSTERDSSWGDFDFKNFKGVILKGINTTADKSFSLGVISIIKKEKFDKIIITDFSTLTGIATILYLQNKHIDYILESDGGFPGKKKGIKYFLKKKIISSARYCLSTAEIHDSYYTTYGAKNKNILRYHFSSVHDRDILQEPLSREKKIEIRNSINMTEEKIVLMVSQIIYRKGIDQLLLAASQMEKNVGIYIVGGKATTEYANLCYKNKLNNVHFIEFKTGEELKQYYDGADIFVLPTREDIWGLVINEALAHALPVVSTTKCISATEMIVNGYNGYVIENEDYKDLYVKINAILHNNELKKYMENNAIETAHKYTIETMIYDHCNFLLERN